MKMWQFIVGYRPTKIREQFHHSIQSELCGSGLGYTERCLVKIPPNAQINVLYDAENRVSISLSVLKLLTKWTFFMGQVVLAKGFMSLILG